MISRPFLRIQRLPRRARRTEQQPRILSQVLPRPRGAECVAFHTGASAHLRAAAPSHSEAKLLYLTYRLTPAPGNLCSGFGPVDPSSRRLTRRVMTCFPGQTVPSRHLGFHRSCALPGAASASDAPARVKAWREPEKTLVTPVFSLNFHEPEMSFWNIIHIQRDEISGSFDC